MPLFANRIHSRALCTVWAPVRSRHLQFPPEFRRAVITILLANNRCQQYVSYFPTSTSSLSTVASSCSHSSSASTTTANGTATATASATAATAMTVVAHSSRIRGAFLPHQIWLQIFSFASR